MLQSIRLLGALGHLHSERELKQILSTTDLVERAYVWEALLRVKDYSVLPDVAKYLEGEPPPPSNLSLPADRLFLMQHRLYAQIFRIRDRVVLPYASKFSASSAPYIRRDALQALRTIGSLESAPIFLKALDDPDDDNGFIAMQSLFELAGGREIDWVPTWEGFKDQRSFYAGRCREWWDSKGQKRAEVMKRIR